MLIKNYSPRKHKTLNYNPTKKQTNPNNNPDQYTEITKDNLEYITLPLDKVPMFQSISIKELHELIKEQQNAIKKEAEIHLKYNLLTKTTYQKTIKQYDQFFLFEDYAFPIQLLTQYINQDTLLDETVIIQQHNKTQPQQQKETPLHNPQPHNPHNPLPLQEYEISRQAIRNITQYTTSPIPIWSYKAPYNTPEYQKPTKIQWQHDLLEDQSDVIVVNGSRQIGKSHTIAERAIEESFIPENDTLVGAFLAKTTNVIRNYILKGTKKFPPDTFIHYKSEGYIVNTQSNTKIYFRTLADDAQNVLGLTLYNIIIDEAQLVDEDVFENALLPTLTTTGGRLILIGTPGKKQKGYYFKKMLEAKKQLEDPTLQKHEIISLYEVTINENPLVHPRTRQRIMEKMDDPAIQRQYFCSWSANTDQLFKTKNINQFPDINKQGYLILGIDPARLADRSGYSLHYVFNHKITTILSGEVPKAHKQKWELQALFYKKMIEKYKPMLLDSKHFIVVMDVGGVGDAVKEIFQKNGTQIDIGIRYTTGFNPDTATQNWKVPKSQMINTTLDFISEELYEIFKQSNKDLLEELEYIYEDELRNGQIAFSSTFFDDITNSTLIAHTVIKERKLLSRAISAETIDIIENTAEAFFAGMEDPNKKFQLNKEKLRRDRSVW